MQHCWAKLNWKWEAEEVLSADTPPREGTQTIHMYVNLPSLHASRRAGAGISELLWMDLEAWTWIPGHRLSHLFMAPRVEGEWRGSWKKAGCCQSLPEHLCLLLQGKDVQKDLTQHRPLAATQGKCQTDVLGKAKGKHII